MPNSIRILAGLPAAGTLLLAAALAQPLEAQKSTTRGFHLGVHLQGASLSIEGDETSDEGGGIGIHVGYGINRIVTLFADLDGAAVTVEGADTLSGDWSMAHVDIGARFHFANSLRRWVPYLEAAVGWRTVGVDDANVATETLESVNFNGGSFSVGGGISVYLSETWALDLGARFTTGEFTEIDLGSVSVNDLDIDAQSGRLNLGIIWWI